MYTSFKELRNHHACVHGYNKLAQSFIGNQAPVVGYIDIKHEWPISLVYIMENNDVLDATWSLRTVNLDKHSVRKIMSFCIKSVGMIAHHLPTEIIKIYEYLKESYDNNTHNITNHEMILKTIRNDCGINGTHLYSYFSAINALLSLVYLLNPVMDDKRVATRTYDIIQYVVRIDDMYTDIKPLFVEMCK